MQLLFNIPGRPAPTFLALNAAGTHQLGAEFARSVPIGTVVGLKGPLGAGKTEFVRGFVAAIGAPDQVSSPTFVLEAVYQGARGGVGFEICHWDLYRLATADRSIELTAGLDLERSITIVEWPERVAAVQDLLSIEISIGFLDPQKDPEIGRFLAELPKSKSAESAPSDVEAAQNNAAASSARVISIELINDCETARRIGVFAQSLDRAAYK